MFNRRQHSPRMHHVIKDDRRSSIWQDVRIGEKNQVCLISASALTQQALCNNMVFAKTRSVSCVRRTCCCEISTIKGAAVVIQREAGSASLVTLLSLHEKCCFSFFLVQQHEQRGKSSSLCGDSLFTLFLNYYVYTLFKLLYFFMLL